MMNDIDHQQSTHHFSFCHLGRFFCCQSSSPFDGNRQFGGTHRRHPHHHHHFLSCSGLLGKYRSCHQQPPQQQRHYQNGHCTLAKNIANGTTALPDAPTEDGRIENGNFTEECFEAATEEEEEHTDSHFYQPRTSLENFATTTSTSAAAPYYYGDLLVASANSTHSPGHFQQSAVRSPTQRRSQQASSQASGGSGSNLLALVMDGLRVQLKRPTSNSSAVRSSGGNGGGSSGVRSKSGTHLRSPNVHRSAEFTVSLRGWLYRLEGAAPLKQWKRRWCVLTDYVLFYYKDINEEKKLGSVLLPSYRISPCFASADGISRRHAFKAEHSNMKTYYFAAECKQTAGQWMNALSLASIMQLAALCPQLGLPPQTNGNSAAKETSKSAKNSAASAAAAAQQTVPKMSGEGQQQPNKGSNHFYPFSPNYSPLSNQQQPSNGGAQNRAISHDEASANASFLAYEEAKQQQQLMMMYGYQSQNQSQSQSQNPNFQAYQLHSSAVESQLNLYNSVGLPIAPPITSSAAGTAFTGEDASAILHAFAPPKPQRLLQAQPNQNPNQNQNQNQNQQFYEDALLTYDHLPAAQNQQHGGSISSSSVLSYNGAGYPAHLLGGSYYPGLDGYYFGTAAAAAAAEEELPLAYQQHRLPPRPHSADFLERDDEDDDAKDQAEEDFDQECQSAFTTSALAAKGTTNNNSSILPSRPKSSMARYGPMLNGNGNGNRNGGLQHRKPSQNTAAPRILSQTAYNGFLTYNSNSDQQPSPLRPPLPSEYKSTTQASTRLKQHTSNSSLTNLKTTTGRYYASTTSEDENCLTSSSRTARNCEDGLIEISKEDVYKASQLFFQRAFSQQQQQPLSHSLNIIPYASGGSSDASSDLNLTQIRRSEQQQSRNTTQLKATSADWNDVGLPTHPHSQASLPGSGESLPKANELPTSAAAAVSGRVKAAKMAFESAMTAASASASAISGSSCSSSLQSFQIISTADQIAQNSAEGAEVENEDEAEVKFKLSSKVRTYRRPKSGGSGSGSCTTGTTSSDTSSDIAPISLVAKDLSETSNSTTTISTATSSTCTSTSSAPYYYSDLLSAEQREQLQIKLACNFAASPPPLLSRAANGSGSGSGTATRLLGGLTTLQGVKNQQTTSVSKPAISSSSTLAKAATEEIVDKEKDKDSCSLKKVSPKKVDTAEKKSTEASEAEVKTVLLKQEQEEADNECNEKLQQQLEMEKEKQVQMKNEGQPSAELLVTGGDVEEGHIYENYQHHHHLQTPASLEQQPKDENHDDALDPGLSGGSSSRHSNTSAGRQKRRVKRRSPREDHHHHSHSHHHQSSNISDSEIAKDSLLFTAHHHHRHHRKSGGGSSGSGKPTSKSSSNSSSGVLSRRLCSSAANVYLQNEECTEEAFPAAAAAISTVRRQLSELQLATTASAKAIELPIELSKAAELDLPVNSTSSRTPTPATSTTNHHQDSPTTANHNLEHLRQQQTALAGELDRVRGLLTHSTRRLEEKAVENAQMEQEMRLARSKLKQVLASEQEAAELARSSKLAAELAHINAVIDDLHSRRQELNRAIEGLKLDVPPPTAAALEEGVTSSVAPLLLRGAYFSQEEEVEECDNSFSSPSSIPLYENIATATTATTAASNDQVNNNNNNNGGLHFNHLQGNSLEDEDPNDLENDEFFTLNINLASKQYGGNKFTSSSNNDRTSTATCSSHEINNNDTIQHNLNSSSTMCEFDPTKDIMSRMMVTSTSSSSSAHPPIIYGSDGSIIDQQIRQIYNYQTASAAAAAQQNSATASAKPTELPRTVREVKREAERRKIVQQHQLQQQQQFNFHSKFGQFYGLNNSAGSGSDLQGRSQQNSFYLLAANHYYSSNPAEFTSPADLHQDQEQAQQNSSSQSGNNVIVAPNGEQFEVLPAYSGGGDYQRAQYTSNGLLPDDHRFLADDHHHLFESKSTTSSAPAAPDIVQSTIKYASGEAVDIAGGIVQQW